MMNAIRKRTHGAGQLCSTDHSHLGPIRQLGYVVENVDAAVEAWQAALHVGPWTIIRNIELSCVHRGKPSKPLVDVALSYRGEQQIELIQQRNNAVSPYLPFIERGHFGLHHTAFLSDRMDEDIAELETRGMKRVCDIRMPGPGAGRYVYFASPIPGEQTFIELLESTLLVRTMFADGMADAREWQGQGRPISLNVGPLLAVMRRLRRTMDPFVRRR